MSVEHHDLHHEFPELNDKIHEMKTNNNHFRRLFDEYHELITQVENMENEVTPVSAMTEEEAKNAPPAFERRTVRHADQVIKLLIDLKTSLIGWFFLS